MICTVPIAYRRRKSFARSAKGSINSGDAHFAPTLASTTKRLSLTVFPDHFLGRLKRSRAGRLVRPERGKVVIKLLPLFEFCRSRHPVLEQSDHLGGNRAPVFTRPSP